MKKIEIMTNRLDKLKESVSITVPGTRKNIRLHAEIREQEVLEKKRYSDLTQITQDMNLVCRICGHSYRICSGMVYCIRCYHVPESHKKYRDIKPPVRKKQTE